METGLPTCNCLYQGDQKGLYKVIDLPDCQYRVIKNSNGITGLPDCQYRVIKRRLGKVTGLPDCPYIRVTKKGQVTGLPTCNCSYQGDQKWLGNISSCPVNTNRVITKG